MAYKNYVNQFYSEKGVRWDIEIWSQSNSSVSSVEFKTGSDGFRLSYKGGDDRRDVVMPSEVTIPFVVSNAADQTFIDSILSGEDGEFFVIIRRNFVIYWWGTLNAGFDAKENNYYPYITTIKANDSIGDVMNNTDESVIDTQDYKLSSILTYYAEVSKIVSNNWDDDVFPQGSDEPLFRTNIRWTAPGQFSYLDSRNKLAMFSANPIAFESGGASVGQFKKSVAFKEMLKAFGLKVFLAEGRLYCIQPYNYTEDTVLIQKLKASNPDLLIGTAYETIDNRQNAQNDSSVAATQDSGFISEEWILNPADFTDSIWEANGSCTSITSNKFNIALTTSYLYIELTEGQYCLSYSENDLTTYIEKFEGGAATTLLDESGQVNVTVGSGGAELRVRNYSTGDVNVEYIGLQKGKFFNRQFLAGTSFRYDRPLSKVLATFNSGVASATAMSNFPLQTEGADIPVSDTIYTSLTSIGSLITTSVETITLYLNLYYGEKFDYLSAINNVTHLGGVITCKLKVGGLYLTGDVFGTLSWTGTDSTFTITMPISEPTNYSGSISGDFANPNTYIFNANLPSTAPYFTGAGTEAYIGVNQPINLPSLSSGGVVSLQFVSATLNYYDDPDTSNPNSAPTPLTVTKNNLQTRFFTGYRYFSNWLPATQYLSLTSTTPNQDGNAQVFSTSTTLDNYKKVDLGTLLLGTTGEAETNINTIKRLDTSGDYTPPTGIQIDNAGPVFAYMTSLLLEQYLEPQVNPLEILQGEYYVNDFSAFKSIVLDGSKYVFFEGTLTASTDIVSGSWYKMAASSETITSTGSGPIIVITDDGTMGEGKPPTQLDVMPSIITGLTNDNINIKNWIKYNSVGVSDTAISSTDTKIDLANNSRSKLYNGQKLIFARPDLSHPIIVTKSGDSTTSDSQIDLASFTPSVTYPAGSILAIAEFDLSNVITGGGGSTSPGGSDTQVQFNDGGSFGADSDFTYNKTTNSLSVTGRFEGSNIGSKTYYNSSSSKLYYYLNPSDFNLSSNSSVNIYSRDKGGSVVSSAYDSRADDTMAFVNLPVGYKIKDLIVYSNVNISFNLEYGSFNTDTFTAIQSGGTTNSTLFLSSAETVDERRYYIVRVEYTATTDEIWGGRITLEKV